MTEPLRILLHHSDPETLRARLQTARPDAEIACHDRYDGLDPVMNAFKPHIAYTVAFHGRAGFPRDALLGCDAPGWISVGGAGVDHLAPWDADKITVTNSAGVAADVMAEYAMAAFLHFAFDIPQFQADKTACNWNVRPMQPLCGQTLLIVGLGHTGRAIAARAKAFGMRVIGTRARPQQTDNVDQVFAATDLPQLWEQADFIAICTPLVPSTRGMVDSRAVAAMKPGAVFVDVSRGGVVQTDAIALALRNGHLKGAALDVFETEPLPKDSPLWTIQNLLISAHTSGEFDGWTAASFDMFLANLARYETNEPLHNVVAPERGY